MNDHIEYLQIMIELDELNRWDQYNPEQRRQSFRLSEAVVLIPLDEANRQLKESAAKREKERIHG